MHLLDVTMLYAPQSGGVVRYLRAKHGWLRRHTSIRHSLLVPGAADAHGANGELFLRTRTRSHGVGSLARQQRLITRDEVNTQQVGVCGNGLRSELQRLRLELLLR